MELNRIAFEPVFIRTCDGRINMNVAFKNTYEMQYVVTLYHADFETCVAVAVCRCVLSFLRGVTLVSHVCLSENSTSFVCVSDT
jgi:hypothetical protein